MALFLDSTQATHWTIPAEQLVERRARSCERAQSERTNARVDENDEADSLTIDDEAILRSYHEERMLRYANTVRLPDKVGATAVIYFKRFFVDRSVTEFNPSVIALSALYAAGKVEEVYLPADRLVMDFHSVVDNVETDLLAKVNNNEAAVLEVDVADGTAMRVTADALLQTELDFLELLQFHLVCYHGFRSVGALREILRNARTWCDDGADGGMEDSDKGSEILGRICEGAHNIVARKVLFTELPLTESPAVIAMAAVATAAVDEGVEADFDIAVDVVLAAAATKFSSVANDNSGVGSAVRAAVWTITEAPNPSTISGSANERGVNGSGNTGKERQRMEMLQQLEARRRRLQIKSNDPLSLEYKQAREARDEARFLAQRNGESPSRSSAGKRERHSVLVPSRASPSDLGSDHENGAGERSNGDYDGLGLNANNEVGANDDGYEPERNRVKRARPDAW